MNNFSIQTRGENEVKNLLSKHIKSTGTLENYTGAVMQYRAYCQKNQIPENEQTLIDFMNKSAKSKSPSTVKIYRAGLKTYLKAMFTDTREHAQIEAIFKSPELRASRVTTSKTITEDDYLTRPEVLSLADAATPKTRVFIKALFYTGCRVSELINAKLNRIKLNGHASLEVIGKGNKARRVYLPLDLYTEIRALNPNSEYLFCNQNAGPLNRIVVFKQIKKLGRKYGYEIHPHTFRHSCAMYLKTEKALTPDMISKHLGHKGPAVTLEFYYHGAPDAKDILPSEVL